MDATVSQNGSPLPPDSQLTGGGFIVDDATPDAIFISAEFTENS